jgi:hypothetical protein
MFAPADAGKPADTCLCRPEARGTLGHMTGGISQQATDTHLNTDSSVTWEGGNLKLCGKIL